jgi:hypothetical protein
VGNRLFTGFVCSLLLLQPTVGAAGAISAAAEMKDTAALVWDRAKAIADAARAAAEVAEAEAELAQAEAELAELEAAKVTAEKAVIKADTAVRQAEEEAGKTAAAAEASGQTARDAAVAEAAARAEIAAAKEALERAKIVQMRAAENEAAESRAAEAEAAQQAAAAAAAAVEQAADNEAKTDEAVMNAEAAADRAYALAQSRVAAAERITNETMAAVEAAEQRLAVAEEQFESSEEARAAAHDAAATAADAHKDLLDAKADADEARKDLLEAKEALNLAKEDIDSSKASLAEAKQQLQPPAKIRSFQLESQYFSWRDNKGRSGHQFYQPYEFNYVHKDTEFSLQTGYVISSYQSGTEGKVSTWTDTLLSVARENTHDKYSVRYNIDINLPTGKSKLNGTNAIMSDDLVALSRFGEGWNYTPGISVSRKIGQEDTWTLGTYYSFRGNYTYDGSTPNGRIDPGGAWGKFLRWQHAGQQWQFVGELAHTNFGRTQEGNVDYREGSQLDAKLTYNRVLSPDRSILLYYWHSTENPYSSSDPAAAGIEGTSTLHNQYFGTVWSKDLPNNRTFRIAAHMMRSSGSAYDPLTDLAVNGRSKYSGGLGYDIAFTPERKLSLDIERFYMKDDSPATSYHGYNIYLRYVADL